ncbi:MAG: ATP-binding protein [Candidatus Eiseniibacteriota bacterium]
MPEQRSWIKWWPVITLAGLVPLIAAVVALLVMVGHLQTDAMETTVSRRAEAVADAIARGVAGEFALIAGLAQSPSLDDGSLDRFRVLANRVAAQHKEWTGLELTDDRRPLFDTRVTQAEAQLPFADADTLRQVWRSGHPVIGNLVHGEIVIRHPVMRGGHVRYTLAAALRPETLSQTLEALHLPAGWLAAVIDGNGIVIGATDTPGGAVGMRYTQQPFAVLDTAVGKVSKAKAADRVKNFAVLMPIAGTTWRVGIAAPIDSVAAPYHAIRALLFAGAGILTLIALVVSTVALLKGKHSMENHRRHLEEELRHAKTRSREKTSFLNAMSHELRAPLNAIIGFAQMIQTVDFGADNLPRYRGYAGDIRVAGEHLLSLVNDVLELAKLEAGKMEIREAQVDLREELRKVDQMMGEQARRAGVKLRFELGDVPIIARVDALKIKQCLINLVSNGVKFTPSGGEVSVALATDRKGLRLIVADTGIGIARADMAKVFEEFGQVDSSVARKHQGTGLGLPLTKRLIELHGGTISLESESGRGTKVTLRLPPARLGTGDALELAQVA